MGIQYADAPKHPGELLIYKMTFTPGKSIAIDDSLTGSPTVTSSRVTDDHDLTNDDGALVPPIVGMLAGLASRVGNAVFVPVDNGDSGFTYDIKILCDTTNGEKNVEEHLVIEVLTPEP